jgi:hypothetical protein
MSIFTTPLSDVKYNDLQELLQESAVENVRLEFKAEVPSKEQVLKKLSSFANTYGGFLLVGATASSSDGRLSGLPGVDPQNNYKQQIVQWCFDGASPPLVVQVSDAIPVPGNTGKVCYVLFVPESELAPHFLNGRKGVWVRTDEFSQRYDPQLATENEIRHLLDRRKLTQNRRQDLVQRSRERFEAWRTQQPIGSGPPDQVEARISISIGPTFPANPVCEQANLAQLFRSARLNWRQTQFPVPRARFVSQHESTLLLTSAAESAFVGLIEANTWGMLYYATELEKRGSAKSSPDNTPAGIHVYATAGYLLAFVKHAQLMLSKWTYEGPLIVNVSLSGILGVPWLYAEHNVGINGPHSALDDSFSFSILSDTSAIREHPDTLVLNVLQQVLFGMNWPEPAGSQEELKKLIDAGYKYNFWNGFIPKY